MLDPNVLDASGSTTIDWYRPSPDGTKVAISLSKGGSESGDVHVHDAASGKPLGKKDLGLLAMSYGGVYVAKVAMGANDTHTVRAFLEGEAFDAMREVLRQRLAALEVAHPKLAEAIVRAVQAVEQAAKAPAHLADHVVVRNRKALDEKLVRVDGVAAELPDLTDLAVRRVEVGEEEGHAVETARALLARRGAGEEEDLLRLLDDEARWHHAPGRGDRRTARDRE